MFKITTEICISCGACFRECRDGAVVLCNNEFRINQMCTECGECAAICPVACIEKGE